MIEDLLPPEVIGVETFSDVPGEPVFPGEEALVANAVNKRRAEFVTARRCAREALAKLGYPAAPIPAGPQREPLWPSRVAGSITHCIGYRAAAVARRAEVSSVGIDAEPHGPLPAGVLESISLPDERAHIAALAANRPDIHWDRLLFCCKEATYKTWFPLTRRFLDFAEARLRFDPPSRSWSAELLVPGGRLDGGPALTGCTGHYLIGHGLILVAAVSRD